MKFTAAALTLALVGAVAAVPIESEVMAKARAVFKRNSPMAEALGKRDLEARASGVTDTDILNFALQLEYLEGQYYVRSVTGNGLSKSLLTGKGTQGKVSGGKKVPFKSDTVRKYAGELAKDETTHVKVLRAALGDSAVAQPAINLDTSFTAAATAAGIIKKGETFDPYSSDTNFLLGSFLFEDVGVTAYGGAAPLISSKAYLAAAASILAVEAYHGAATRVQIYAAGSAAQSAADKAAAAIGSLDTGKSEGLTEGGLTNFAPDDNNSLAYTRTPGEVLNIVYLNPAKGAAKGGFFPNGLNGNIKVAAGSGN